MASPVLPLVARVVWVGLLVMAVTYAAHSSASRSAVSPDLLPYGGLSSLWKCSNSWNWHVILLTAAFVVAMVESVLAFRAPLVKRPSTYIWFHLFWQTVAIVCAVLGMVAIVHSKLCGGYQHMYSVHAWTGALVLVLFLLQHVVGFLLMFVSEYVLPPALHQDIVIWHMYMGRLVLFGGIGACVNGWADIQMMQVGFGQYHYKSATMLGSASAVLLWGLGTIMAAILFRSEFPPRTSKSFNAPERTPDQKPVDSHKFQPLAVSHC